MGRLHERNTSLWIATTPETAHPPLLGEVSVDVAVIGSGITGLSTAALLKRAGARVAVIEAGRVASGVTGYTTAKVTSLHGIVYRNLVEELGEERARLYAALFDATRLDLTHSATTLITEKLDAAKHFVGDRLTTLGAPPLEKLPAGEGMIVEVDGERVAAYRDEGGAVHALSPFCAQMGCLVTWNSAETTWVLPVSRLPLRLRGPSHPGTDREESGAPCARSPRALRGLTCKDTSPLHGGL